MDRFILDEKVNWEEVKIFIKKFPQIEKPLVDFLLNKEKVNKMEIAIDVLSEFLPKKDIFKIKKNTSFLLDEEYYCFLKLEEKLESILCLNYKDESIYIYDKDYISIFSEKFKIIKNIYKDLSFFKTIKDKNL